MLGGVHVGKRSAGSLLALIILVTIVPPPASGAPVLGLGMDMSSVGTLQGLGAPPTYGSFWVGEWMQQYGWGGLDNSLRTALDKGVTPVVYWYYWGDSISTSCVQNGCNGRTRAEWDSMTTTLADHVSSIMGGRTVYIVLENEFNKGGIDSTTYAPTFDTYLEAKANQLKGVSGVKVILGYGAWGEENWGRFPKAIAASDMIGFQMMRGQTRDTEAVYRGAPDKVASVLTRIGQLQSGKSAFLYDLAFSSYPDAYWERVQGETMGALLNRSAEYQTKGLVGIIYRELYDNPNMDPANYFGYAEQHWGLRSANAAKPAWSAWVGQYSGASPPPAPAAPSVPGTFEAEAMTASTGGRQSDAAASGQAVWNVWTNGDLSQRVSSSGGAYKVSVVARGMSAGGVWPNMELRVNGATVASWTVGSTTLTTYAHDVTLANGNSTLAVAFTNDGLTSTEDRNLLVDVVRVTSNGAPFARFVASGADLAWSFDSTTSSDPDGDALTYAWSFGDGSTGSGARASRTYATGGSYTVTLTVSDGTAQHSASQTITARSPNGAPTASFTVSGSALAWSFDASASSDPEGGALTYAWSFGDGTSGTGRTTSRTYAAAGTYTVTLTVSDGALTASTTRNVAATSPNRAPIADATASGAGLAWSFSATGSSDPDGDPLTYAWSFGDGSSGSGATASRTYGAPGTYTVKLTVSDGRGGTATKTLSVQATVATAYRALEAEQFGTRDNGAAFADGGASAQSAWLLWSNGALAHAFAPGAGVFRVDVVAKGDAAEGWPFMELRADGVTIANWSVASSSWATYSTNIVFTPGQTRTLSIVFTNDKWTPSADRNLRVDVVRLVPATLVTQVEAFSQRSGGSTFTDTAAMEDRAWLQSTNGAATQSFAPGAGVWRVEVRARGDYASGWPKMELRVDGVAVATWTVSSNLWGTYAADVTWGAGAKSVSIAFVNDYKRGNSDRNLRLDTLTLAAAG